MTWALAILTALLALVNWTSVARGRARTEWWSKLLTMVGLLTTAVAAGALDDSPGRWLVAALVLGLVGDWAMLGDTEARLLGGVATFFAGHLAYLICFVALGLSPRAWSLLVLLVLVATSWPTRAVVPTAWRARGPGLALPLLAYTAVISAMTVVAFLTGEPLVALGATSFVVSDSLIALGLARSGFRHEERGGAAHLAVMVTYHAGQALLTAGVLLAR